MPRAPRGRGHEHEEEEVQRGEGGAGLLSPNPTPPPFSLFRPLARSFVRSRPPPLGL